jgi:hypothetical protein
MNTVEEKSHKQSHHTKYRDFTLYRIAKLINIYNNTQHDTTHEIPAEMDRDWETEEKFIIKKLYQTEQRKRISDFELNDGAWVRYIIPKDPKKKRRYSLTPEKFKVVGHDGHAYLIQARDGDIATVPRWRLKREDDHEKYQWAQIIPLDLGPTDFLAGEIKDIDGKQMKIMKQTGDGEVEVIAPLSALVGQEEENRFRREREENVNETLINTFDQTKLKGMAMLINMEKLYGEQDYGRMTELFMPFKEGAQWMLVRVTFRRRDRGGDQAIPSLYSSYRRRGGYPDVERRVERFLEDKVKKINEMEYPRCPKQTNEESSYIFMIANAMALFKNDPLPKKVFPELIHDIKRMVR